MPRRSDPPKFSQKPRIKKKDTMLHADIVRERLVGASRGREGRLRPHALQLVFCCT